MSSKYNGSSKIFFFVAQLKILKFWLLEMKTLWLRHIKNVYFLKITIPIFPAATMFFEGICLQNLFH